jgi:hypothetical protein
LLQQNHRKEKRR